MCDDGTKIIPNITKDHVLIEEPYCLHLVEEPSIKSDITTVNHKNMWQFAIPCLAFVVICILLFWKRNKIKFLLKRNFGKRCNILVSNSLKSEEFQLSPSFDIAISDDKNQLQNPMYDGTHQIINLDLNSEQLVTHKEMTIDFERISFDNEDNSVDQNKRKILGKGHFGIVYRGIYLYVNVSTWLMVELMSIP